MTYEEAIRLIRRDDECERDCIDCINSFCDMRIARLMAVEALEKQTPKKVEWTLDHTWGIEKEVPVCPTCGYYLTPIEFIDANICEQTGHCEFLKISYCEHCSQAIDWSEEE